MLWCLIVAIAGCESRLSATDERRLNLRQSSPLAARIDAGLVFVDRSGYFCLPLERVGLDSGEVVETLNSSCDCVRPSLVEYKSAGGTTARGVMLEYVAEVGSGGSDVRPANLGVVIEIGLSAGRKQKFTFELLHTAFAAQERP